MEKIVFYMGAYIEDDSYEDINLTYDNDPKANYRLYFNLRTAERYLIDKEEVQGYFKKGDIIINIPVEVCSFDIYLKNYIKVKKWFLGQLIEHGEKSAIEELKRKYGKYIELDKSEEIDESKITEETDKMNKIKVIRETIKSLESEILEISKRESALYEKLDEIRKNCNHKVIVKVNNVYIDENGNSFPDEYCCLFCNDWYTSYDCFPSEIEDKDIIHFEGKKFNDLTAEEKVEIAFNMFKEEKEKSPESGNSEIVKTINDSLGYNEKDIINKILSNKPDLKN